MKGGARDFPPLAKATILLLYHYFKTLSSKNVLVLRKNNGAVRFNKIVRIAQNRRKLAHIWNLWVDTCIESGKSYSGCVSYAATIIHGIVSTYASLNREPFKTLYEMLRSDIVYTDMVRLVLAPYVQEIEEEFGDRIERARARVPVYQR